MADEESRRAKLALFRQRKGKDSPRQSPERQSPRQSPTRLVPTHDDDGQHQQSRLELFRQRKAGSPPPHSTDAHHHHQLSSSPALPEERRQSPLGEPHQEEREDAFPRWVRSQPTEEGQASVPRLPLEQIAEHHHNEDDDGGVVSMGDEFQTPEQQKHRDRHVIDGSLARERAGYSPCRTIITYSVNLLKHTETTGRMTLVAEEAQDRVQIAHRNLHHVARTSQSWRSRMKEVEQRCATAERSLLLERKTIEEERSGNRDRWKAEDVNLLRQQVEEERERNRLEIEDLKASRQQELDAIHRSHRAELAIYEARFDHLRTQLENKDAMQAKAMDGFNRFQEEYIISGSDPVTITYATNPPPEAIDRKKNEEADGEKKNTKSKKKKKKSSSISYVGEQGEVGAEEEEAGAAAEAGTRKQKKKKASPTTLAVGEGEGEEVDLSVSPTTATSGSGEEEQAVDDEEASEANEEEETDSEQETDDEENDEGEEEEDDDEEEAHRAAVVNAAGIGRLVAEHIVEVSSDSECGSGPRSPTQRMLGVFPKRGQKSPKRKQLTRAQELLLEMRKKEEQERAEAAEKRKAQMAGFVRVDKHHKTSPSRSPERKSTTPNKKPGSTDTTTQRSQSVGTTASAGSKTNSPFVRAPRRKIAFKHPMSEQGSEGAGPRKPTASPPIARKAQQDAKKQKKVVPSIDTSGAASVKSGGAGSARSPRTSSPARSPRSSIYYDPLLEEKCVIAPPSAWGPAAAEHPARQGYLYLNRQGRSWQKKHFSLARGRLKIGDSPEHLKYMLHLNSITKIRSMKPPGHRTIHAANPYSQTSHITACFSIEYRPTLQGEIRFIEFGCAEEFERTGWMEAMMLGRGFATAPTPLPPRSASPVEMLVGTSSRHSAKWEKHADQVRTGADLERRWK